jgi:hypothetical protein
VDTSTKVQYWRLVARKKSGLLVAMMEELVGNARISFEGDLSKCRLAQILGAASDETAILKRNTLSPVQDFIVIPLELETIRPIIAGVLPEGGVVHNIIHVQIEKDGKLAFGAYDNFYPECVICSPVISKAMLDHLVENGVLKSYCQGQADFQIALDRLHNTTDPVISGEEMKRKLGMRSQRR